MKKMLSIRMKVGMLLSVLVLVILYMSMTRIGSLRQNEATFLELTESTRISFETMSVLRLSSVQIDGLARSVLAAEDVAKLKSVEAAIDSNVVGAREALSDASFPEEEITRIFQSLDALEQRMTGAIQAKSRHLIARQDLKNADRQLSRTLDLLQAQLNRLATSFQLDLLSGGGDQALRSEELFNMRVATSGLLDLGRTLATLSDPAQTQLVISEITSRIGTTLWAISALGEFAEREETLRLISDLRENIQGDRGVQINADRLLAAEADLDLATGRLRSALSSARATLDNTAARSEHDIALVYDAAREATRDAMFSEILFSWFVAGGLIAAVWAVFSQQISRRIEALSEDVLRIANGDVDTPTCVQGNDEIGRMGQALAVFRRNARELYRSNEQLDDFAYVASHDLRSPLRAIRDLVEWTFEDSEGDLTPEVATNLTLIRDRAERLSHLLSDLLTYARAELTEKSPEVVDLMALTRESAEMADPSKQFSINYRGDRHAISFPTPLRTILLNLIGNAITHHDHLTGCVSVIGRVERNRLILEVRDDGPGIAAQYHGQIFNMFQTLRVSDELEGRGMGLALVRKLARSLEGDISVSSNPTERRGTKFILNIPIGIQTAVHELGDSTQAKGAAA